MDSETVIVSCQDALSNATKNVDITYKSEKPNVPLHFCFLFLPTHIIIDICLRHSLGCDEYDVDTRLLHTHTPWNAFFTQCFQEYVPSHDPAEVRDHLTAQRLTSRCNPWRVMAGVSQGLLLYCYEM